MLPQDAPEAQAIEIAGCDAQVVNDSGNIGRNLLVFKQFSG
jgi:hypothetical protein